MCARVGSHAPSCERQLCRLPSGVEYLLPQGVLLPGVYGTIAPPLWLELRGLAAWQVTPSWAVSRQPCHQLLPWFRVTFAMVPDAAWPGLDQWPWSTAPATSQVGRLGCPSASDPEGADRCVLFFAALAACASVVFWPTCGLFTRAHALCVGARCPRPRGSSPPVRALCAVCVCCYWFCRGPSLPPLFFPPFFCLFVRALYLFSLLLQLCCFFFLVFFLFLLQIGGSAHCRHRHGQRVQRCSSVAFLGVRRRCFVGGHGPGVRLARLDVHGCRSGWVWLVVSLRFGAGWLGGHVGCGCGLWLLCTLGGLGEGSRVRGYGGWLVFPESRFSFGLG